MAENRGQRPTFERIPYINVVPDAKQSILPTISGQTQRETGSDILKTIEDPRQWQVLSTPAHSAKPVNFEQLPVVSMTVVGRLAVNGVDNAMHVYIDIARKNDGQVVHQTLGAYPIGGAALSHEGGQLLFQADAEKGQIPLFRSRELNPPPGLNRTEYANALVQGAKEYQRHAVRYDGIGEDGFNSGSFISSLMVAKGGQTAMRDLEQMRRDGLHTSPLRTNPADTSWDDGRMSEQVARDMSRGIYDAPGVGHAAIGVDRFAAGSRVAAEQNRGPQHTNVYKAIRGGESMIRHRLTQQLQTAEGHFGWTSEPTPDPTLPPYETGQGIRIRESHQIREVGAGFTQSGQIVSRGGNSLMLKTGNGDTEYNLFDLRERLGSPKDFDEITAVGQFVQINVNQVNAVEIHQLSRQWEMNQSRNRERDWGR